jgi:SAM-dependent methyltransferase
MNDADALRALVRSASDYYRPAGRFALHFARNKLRYDAAYRTILAQGLLAGRSQLLDLGCGQGLLAAWLHAARHTYAQAPHAWPRQWPAPPAPRGYCGIDINAREVRRAREALLPAAIPLSVTQGDIAAVAYPQADAVVMLDVLHYLDLAAHEQVLRRVRTALTPGGLLLLRVGDAAGGLGHRLGKAVDQTVALLRHGRWNELACRAVSDWQQLLTRCGFAPQPVPPGMPMSFVNVLLRAQPA